MRTATGMSGQRGVALVVALLFLLVVTIISVIAASNSTLSLKMSSNMQDSMSSFQAAEAGAMATVSLAGSANDPFAGVSNLNPFSAFDPTVDHPLRDITGGAASVDVDVFLTTANTACPRRELAYSTDLIACDYYRVASEHSVARRARSKVNLGVVKTIIGNINR